jgi:hypothetical protein
VQNESHRKMLAFFYDRMQLRTPKGVKSEHFCRGVRLVGFLIKIGTRWCAKDCQGERCRNMLAFFYGIDCKIWRKCIFAVLFGRFLDA